MEKSNNHCKGTVYNVNVLNREDYPPLKTFMLVFKLNNIVQDKLLKEISLKGGFCEEAFKIFKDDKTG